MSAYKDLNIDRNKLEELIPTAIYAVFNKLYLYTLTNIGIAKMLIISAEVGEVKIAFYYNKKGSTTINPDVGNQTELSNKIAEILINNSKISEKDNFSFCIPKLEQQDLLNLLKTFEDEKTAKVISDEKQEICRIIKLSGVQQNDKITIKHYSSGKVQFQGRPILLYKHICLFLSENCAAKDIIKAQEEFYKIEIKKDNINTEFNAYFPQSKDFLGDKLKEIILPTFTILHISIELSDYSLFVFPILKGLEGYIKKLFNDNKIVTKREALGSYFTKYDNDSRLKIKKEYRDIINNEKICIAIEKAFEYFTKQRNTLFHVDGAILPTRTIETIEEAKTIIFETIDIIENTYQDMA